MYGRMGLIQEHREEIFTVQGEMGQMYLAVLLSTIKTQSITSNLNHISYRLKAAGVALDREEK
ncbi:hypothetical protein C5167_007335 [Papaver somniferum]|nr:hypothetical protein C5167_007335 [Papaver somniferum]